MKKLRTKALRIRLTPEEHDAIAAAGEMLGLGICTFARMAAIRAAGRKPAPPPRRHPEDHAVALARWTGQLAVIGNNLNQLAKAHNSGCTVDPGDLAGVRDELHQLRDAVLTFHAEPPAPGP